MRRTRQRDHRAVPIEIARVSSTVLTRAHSAKLPGGRHASFVRLGNMGKAFAGIATMPASWPLMRLARANNAPASARASQGLVSEIVLEGESGFTLLKPQTYMNESGALRRRGGTLLTRSIPPHRCLSRRARSFYRARVRVKTGGGNAAITGLRSGLERASWHDYRPRTDRHRSSRR